MIDADRILAGMAAIDPVFLNSPQFRSEGLSTLLGSSLVCKLETTNPIGCFKGRGADRWLRTHRPRGRVICASAGNFGQAVAYCGRTAGTAVEVFAAETANPAKLEAIRRLGAEVRIFGSDFDSAKDEAQRVAEAEGGVYVEDGREDEIAEGAGTIAVELLRFREAIDVVYVPVGNGALANGIGSWCRAHSPSTRIVGVCAQGATSMRESWRQGRAVATGSVDTIADGVAVRVPVQAALDHLAETVDDMVLVSDAEIWSAMRAYLDHERLLTEPAGAVSLAAAMARAADDRGATVATIITGNNLATGLRRRLLAEEAAPQSEVPSE